ncbi:response regulator transcription factor [Halalkalibacter okhensis]|uniref:AraC family transcriptional regulator n=1 Tax=Halalkalibacter okhensis TaxID=333138 RepID=A0A0B0IFI1_9BACI|nr:helix-turn-helix domain-containing protein [Halalkalibacter okhensis]KHF41328.1 hypothetical protein LQ50_03580 [Halalkalibacter okhensis]
MKILVIEDEPLIRKGLLTLLSKIEVETFQITELTDLDCAEEADLLLETNKYDLIFTDIEMGAMDGLGLIKKWQGIYPDTQWIIVSGYDRFEFAQQAIQYGVKEYLLKPVTKAKISATVERCIQNLKEQNHDFVTAVELEWLLEHLEQAIWAIDGQKVEGYLTTWRQKVLEKSIHPKYYCDLLSHSLEVLFRNISNKGGQMFQSFQWEINESSIEKANDRLQEKCFEIIERVEEKRKGNEVDPIEVAKEYINENLNRDVSLDEVAIRLGLNSSYFSQLFKKETGETFIQYRIRHRMDLAKKLLLQKNIRVTDIPGLIGLNDHPHFTKTFKKFTGQTPSEYRLKMGID